MSTILYVEDNPDNVYMLTRRLKKKGYTMLTAEDGLSGVNIAVQKLPDLILMDLILPKLDGWGSHKKNKSKRKNFTYSNHCPFGKCV